MPQRASILIVEDEPDLAELIRFHLTREGYACRCARNGEHALAEAQRQPPDLLLLDRMLPGLSGDEVARRLRRDDRTAQLPIIMLTAKATDEDELVGFALGVDDYVRKPFAMKLLLARVAAVLRREQEPTDHELLAAGELVVDRARHEVRLGGRVIDLTATEFRILAKLMSVRGRVLSREQLIDAVMGPGAAVTNRAMDVHIAALRKKLIHAGDWIHTVRGVGYAFRSPEGAPQES
ncbi:MAG: response regulator transcription factor [Planctomycetota bacterium]